MIARRFCGAVAITEKSRMPSSDIASVRGIGVAVSVSTSTSARSCFSASFWRTPKRCSSSMITRPRRLSFTSRDSSLCVPMTMSISPLASFFDASPWLPCAIRKRDSSAIFTGQSAKRSVKVWKCCSASSVVGQRTTTCLLSATATNAARSATSVLPKPTSPHTRRSIGLPAAMSVTTASIAAAWSGVSSKPKPVGERLEVVLLDREGMALARGALRVQREQLGRGVAHLLRGARLRLVPLAAAELVQRRFLGLRAAVAADHAELRHRHVELVAAFVLEQQELGLALAEIQC